MTDRMLAAVALGAALAGCYTGARTERDINRAWQGRHLRQIEARWGAGEVVGEREGVTAIRWHHTRRGVRLPTGAASVSVEPGRFEAYAEVRPGRAWSHTTEVIALVGGDGVIREVRGPSLRWGPPDDANVHWGLLFGAHVGMGRLDDTSTPLPSGGLYIGGMLSRQLGLVGSFSMVSGLDDDGGAMGFAWALAPQYWATTRLSVRAGPAAILAFDPGFENVGFEPGVNAQLSYAVIKAGTFALDLRVDLTGGSDTRFGTAGVGVNLN